jgi:uncharacterized protein YpuA (DUF1002 family)
MDALRTLAGNQPIAQKLERIELELTEDQIMERQARLAQLALDMQHREDDKAGYMASWKQDFAPVKQEFTHVLREIETGKTTTQMLVHLVPDYNLNQMHLFDMEGTLIHTRELRFEERQLRVL